MAKRSRLTHLQRFYWQRYEQANELILHGNREAGVDICLDLVLKSDLSVYLRGMAYATLATYTDVRVHPDKLSFVERSEDVIRELEEDNCLEELPELRTLVAAARAEASRQMEEYQSMLSVSSSTASDESDRTEGGTKIEDVILPDVVETTQEQLERLAMQSPATAEPDLPPATQPTMPKYKFHLPTPPQTSDPARPPSDNGHDNNTGGGNGGSVSTGDHSSGDSDTIMKG